MRGALKRWVPGAQLVALAVEQNGPQLTLRVRVREKGVTATVSLLPMESNGSRTRKLQPYSSLTYSRDRLI
ncbi:MAG: hypothetical protein KF782_12560 [Labilithrix sp.]|nr:hypothetical protein [Labilithrix sp.]